MTDQAIPGACRSLMHEYTETSARSRLARRRAKGEELSMIHCPWGDHWHTYTEAERAHLGPPCRECGGAEGPPSHIYGERKCCPDCDHRLEDDL